MVETKVELGIDETALVPASLVRIWSVERAGKRVTLSNTRGAGRSEALIKADFLTDLSKQECGG